MFLLHHLLLALGLKKKKRFLDLFLLNFCFGMDDENTTTQEVCCKSGFHNTSACSFPLVGDLKKKKGKLFTEVLVWRGL